MLRYGSLRRPVAGSRPVTLGKAVPQVGKEWDEVGSEVKLNAAPPNATIEKPPP
jgi:hypothetical protein